VRSTHKNHAGKTPAVKYREKKAASAKQKAATHATVLSVASHTTKKYEPARMKASPGISAMVSRDQKAISGVVTTNNELQKAPSCHIPVLLKIL